MVSESERRTRVGERESDATVWLARERVEERESER